ncbi:unnamed protein product, partial [Cyprideis torosa]
MMGAGRSKEFTEQELEEYAALTYLTKPQILDAYKRFRSLDPPTVRESKMNPVGMIAVMTLPELRVNPFAARMCHVFSSSGDGNLSFEDFLDLLSVLSPNAPKSLKLEYSFRIYDFDGDDVLGPSDLTLLMDSLTSPDHLDRSEKQLVVQHILEEADLDEDGALSFAEYEHMLSKVPDFEDTFSILDTSFDL